MPSTRKQQIAALVRDARVAKGWTQTELAERVGVNMQTISHIERALHKPSRQGLLERLEDALDTDLSAEAQVLHTMIDEIVHQLSKRIADMGAADGMRFTQDILEDVQDWKPRGRRSAGGKG